MKQKKTIISLSIILLILISCKENIKISIDRDSYEVYSEVVKQILVDDSKFCNSNNIALSKKLNFIDYWNYEEKIISGQIDPIGVSLKSSRSFMFLKHSDETFNSETACNFEYVQFLPYSHLELDKFILDLNRITLLDSNECIELFENKNQVSEKKYSNWLIYFFSKIGFNLNRTKSYLEVYYSGDKGFGLPGRFAGSYSLFLKKENSKWKIVDKFPGFCAD